MTRVAVIAVVALAAAAPASARAPAPGIAVAATPSRVLLGPGSGQIVRLVNRGSTPAVVEVARAALAFDGRGVPRVGSLASAPGWLAVSPRRVVVSARGEAAVAVSARPPATAAAGEHGAIVLLTTTQLGGQGVPVHVRIGVTVTLRMPGRVIRRLEPGRLGVRRDGAARLLVLEIANRGNVFETVRASRVRLVVSRGGRVVATLAPAPRVLVPRSRGSVTFRCAGLRGDVTVRAVVAGGPARRYRVRL